MRAAVIRKSVSALRPPPNLGNEDEVRRGFSWNAACAAIGATPGGPLDIGQVAVDRHLATPVADHVAYRFVGRGGARRDFTSRELAAATNRFGNVLRALGVGKGVIYPPQVALVGFGRATERPWVEDGRVVVAPVLTASLSADHRASDGHRGALFLAEIARLLQEPAGLDGAATRTSPGMTSMDDSTLRRTVFDALQRIAPEVASDEVAATRPLREQVDPDSMDWRNFLLALHKAPGVEIPERDYASLVTLDDLFAYLRPKVA